jgi:hypothetical protein
MQQRPSSRRGGAMCGRRRLPGASRSDDLRLVMGLACRIFVCGHGWIELRWRPVVIWSVSFEALRDRDQRAADAVL